MWNIIVLLSLSSFVVQIKACNSSYLKQLLQVRMNILTGLYRNGIFAGKNTDNAMSMSCNFVPITHKMQHLRWSCQVHSWVHWRNGKNNVSMWRSSCIAPSHTVLFSTWKYSKTRQKSAIGTGKVGLSWSLPSSVFLKSFYVFSISYIDGGAYWLQIFLQRLPYSMV